MASSAGNLMLHGVWLVRSFCKANQTSCYICPAFDVVMRKVYSLTHDPFHRSENSFLIKLIIITVNNVDGTRYTSAGCPSFIVYNAANVIRRPMPYAKNIRSMLKCDHNKRSCSCRKQWCISEKLTNRTGDVIDSVWRPCHSVKTMTKWNE